MSHEEEQQPERQPAEGGRGQPRTPGAHEVPAGAEGDESHEGDRAARPAGRESATDRRTAGSSPVDSGQALSGAGREQEHEGGDGQVLQVPDTAALGPHAAIGVPVGASEAADAREHVDVRGKAEQPEAYRGAGQTPPELLGWPPGQERAASVSGSAAEQNAQAQAGAPRPFRAWIGQVAIVDEAPGSSSRCVKPK